MRRSQTISAFVVLGLLVIASLFAMTGVVAESVQVEWTRQFGSSDFDVANDVATDDSGYEYVAGFAAGALPGQTHLGEWDAFVRKYDSSGNEIWTRQFGTSSNDAAEGIHVDASGGVYVVGRTYGALSGQTGGGGWDAFIRKYDSNGGELWTRQFSFIPDSDEMAWDVTVDSSGNSYVAGQWENVIDEFDAFVVKFNSFGNSIGMDTFGSPLCDESAEGVHLDDFGNVYVVGYTFGEPFGQPSNGFQDAFIRKYDMALNDLQSLQFGAPDYDYATAVATDSSGNPIVVGAERNSSLFPLWIYDAFIWKFDPGLNEIQSLQFGTIYSDGAYDVVLDDDDNVYVVGYQDELPRWDAAPIPSEAFARKFDSGLIQIWEYVFGTSGWDYARGVDLDNLGNVYIAGDVAGALPGQNASGGVDAYLIKLGRSPGEACPLTQGFWKNHPDDWPVNSLDLGNRTYDKAELLDILSTPARGDASLILAHQLIAAKLNVAHGSDPGPIASDISDGDTWLSSFSGRLPYGVLPSTDAGKDMTATADALDSYNNRDLTPACTEDEDDDDDTNIDDSSRRADNGKSTGRTQNNGGTAREILNDIDSSDRPSHVSFFLPVIGILVAATGTILIVWRRSKRKEEW
jgi:hypothetical protein